MREVFLEEGKKHLRRAGFQEQAVGVDEACAGLGRGSNYILKVSGRVGNLREHRGAVDPHADAGLRQRVHGLQAQVGARGPRLEDASQLCLQSGNGDHDAQRVLAGDGLQHPQIPQNEVGLGYQAKPESLMLGEFLQNTAGDFKLAFSGLVRVGRGANGDLVPGTNLPELLAKQPGGVLLDVNLAFEVQSVAQLHKLMGVTGIAILTSELASAVRIDHPFKRHARRSAASQQAAVLERQILDLMSLRNSFSLSCQAGNTNQGSLRFGLREESAHQAAPADSLFIRSKRFYIMSRGCARMRGTILERPFGSSNRGVDLASRVPSCAADRIYRAGANGPASGRV